jgi:hypothetical protein
MNELFRSAIQALADGEIEIKGEFLWGSNYTFLAWVKSPGCELKAVYKPTRGARPLWDFPVASLAKRETAAFEVSEALGWELLPPTVYRRAAPLGPGSLQMYIEHDPEYNYFNFTPLDKELLRIVATFDLLVNNADRKGSHVIKDPAGRLWLIDHGVCFHVEDKLRTVIWDFVGESIPQQLLEDLQRLSDALEPVKGKPSTLSNRLLAYLSREEIRALRNRALRLVQSGMFPAPDPNRRPFPWPQI